MPLTDRLKWRGGLFLDLASCYSEATKGEVAESYQRIIRHPSADQYRLAGWALCPYSVGSEVHDGCAPVYFFPCLLLNGCAGSRSPTTDG